MKWFKKWFQGKCEKQTESMPSTSKAQPWKNKLNSLSDFIPPDDDFTVAVEALEALDVYVPVRSEVFAFTTIKNFRADSLNEHVYESDWVVVSRKQMMEPKFQRRLKKADTLTDLCRSMAERSVNRRRAEVVAKPPNCHCHELDSCKSEKSQRTSIFRRIFNSFTRFCRLIYRKVRNCKIFKSEDVIEIPKATEDLLGSFHSTNSYLCR